MSYATYKVIHILSALAVFLALGAALAPGAGKAPKWIAPLHGTALLFSLVAGFGLLARLGLTQGMPGWVVGKLVIWLALGGSLALIKRKLLPAPALVAWLLGLGGLAAFLAIFK